VNFGSEYAGVYDALYENKDYEAEAAFVLDQMHGHVPDHANLLDLGCGTGLHAVALAKRGYFVTGIDRSADMIELAQCRRADLSEALASQLHFETGDMRSTDLKRSYDAVLSLFHVICYMTEDVMLQEALGTMRRHLQPGGVLLFDFWNADAVLNDPPAPRERIIQTQGQSIRRVTTPIWEPDKSLVHITYDMWKTGADGVVSKGAPETHSIRYFLVAEIERHLKDAGFSALHFGEWLTGGAPTKESFGVYCLAQAV
jgi:SAM-dependent methyltransferase